MPETGTINPKTLSEALEAKATRGVVAVAGGTDILVRLHDVVDRPWPRLLVLEGVRSLRKIIENDGYISIGTLVTFSEIENSARLNKYASQLTGAASVAGSVQIRNRATIGGNIANGSPAGDLIPPLYVLGAELELSSVDGKRIVPIETFFKGPGKTILRSNELITSIRIKKHTSPGFFNRLTTRRALAISKVSVAASAAFKQGVLIDLKIALGAVGPTVIRAERTEQALLKRGKLCPGCITGAAKIAKGEACPIDDLRSTAEYRREMVAVLLKRGLTQIYESIYHVPQG